MVGPESFAFQDQAPTDTAAGKLPLRSTAKATPGLLSTSSNAPPVVPGAGSNAASNPGAEALTRSGSASAPRCSARPWKRAKVGPVAPLGSSQAP